MSLTAFLKSYTRVVNLSKMNEVYDNVSDKYLLYAITNLGATGSTNLKNMCPADKSFGASRDEIWYLRQSGNNKQSLPYVDFCWSKFFTSNDERQRLFDDFGLVYFYYINDSIGNIISGSVDRGNPTYFMDNGTLDYIQTLSKNKKYAIGVFRKSNKYYYASIVIE